MNAPTSLAPVRLDALALGRAGVIAAIDWVRLGDEGRRLRELGFDEGVRVEPLHRGFLGRDPLAVRIGRMTVALRRAQAAAVTVRPDAA